MNTHVQTIFTKFNHLKGSTMFNNMFKAKRFSLRSTATAVTTMMALGTAVLLSACGGGGGGGGASGPDGTVVSDSQMTFAINKSGVIQAVASSSIAVVGTASIRSVGAQKNTIAKIAWTVTATSSGSVVLPTFSDAQCVNLARSLNDASCSNTIVLPDNITPDNYVVTGTATGSEGSARSGSFTIQVVSALASSHIDTLSISSLPIYTGLNQAVVIPATFSFKSGIFVAPSDVSLTWSQTAGPSVLFAGQGTSSISFLPVTAGSYGFNVKLSALINGVTETRIASVVVVAVATQFFNLSAGPIQSIPVGQVVTLSGTVSNLSQIDATVSYMWTLVSGPSLDSITNANSPMASFLPSAVGSYLFQLTAKTANYTQSATTLVVVLPPDPNAFDINAGIAQVINMPNTVVSLTGTFLANSGAVASNPGYQWSQVSGPTAILSNDTSLLASFIPKGAGIYVFQLSATARGLTKVASTQVTVLGEVDPNYFYVYAGDAQTKAPNSVVTLTGTVTAGSGLAGKPQTYLWTQTAGPVTVTLSNPGSKTPSFVTPAIGAYTFVFATTINGVKQTSQTTVNIQ